MCDWGGKFTLLILVFVHTGSIFEKKFFFSFDFLVFYGFVHDLKRCDLSR